MPGGSWYAEEGGASGGGTLHSLLPAPLTWGASAWPLTCLAKGVAASCLLPGWCHAAVGGATTWRMARDSRELISAMNRSRRRTCRHKEGGGGEGHG